MLNILSIGNSFSEDAQHYLHDLDAEIHCVNLYIGGCSLEQHWDNAEHDLAAYDLQINGKPTNKKVSIKAALESEKWNYVTLQQASHDSGIIKSYFPFTKKLSAYVTKYCPEAKQLIHQTWAYEIDSEHELFFRYHRNQEEMYQALHLAYANVAKELGLSVISVGDILQLLRKEEAFAYGSGGLSLYRDGYHLSLDYGRYAAAAIWLEFLTGQLERADFQPEHTDLEHIEQIKSFVLKNIKMTLMS
ncbi:MAG: DUF4886 domain-containing protein [Streptococcaceae bacterium]|jgi:hypothetical protein|nr:DUF4886 domain-containing protein [Streptococcaceae bacterium]